MARGTEPSNLGKVFWPDAGLTKGDLLEYLQAAGSVLVSALRDRPLTVKRYPDGIEGPFFFQKNTPRYAPDWVRTVRLGAPSARRDVDYTLCNSKRTLMWLGNQASIELHPWTSRVDRLDRPDHLVFDLDPIEGGFQMAVDAALLLREVLAEVGLQGTAKTSGSKGIHVYVPLIRRHSFGRVRRAAVELGERLEQRAPDLATGEFHISRRRGRVFIDAGRNGMGAHVVAQYSPRARPGAPVSFPVPWDDLRDVGPQDFTIRSVPELLAGGRDPWRDLMPRAQSLSGPDG
jgi:bifunctional non-homologous end joining protein LigD